MTLSNHKVFFGDDKLIVDFKLDNKNISKKHNIVVLDISGSMHHVYKLLQKFTREMISLININNYLTIITFGTNANIILDRYQDGQDINVDSIIDEIQNGGTTNGVAAIDKIQEIISKYDDFYNVIFLTDGAFNEKLVHSEYKIKNTIFNTVGFTHNHDNQMLNVISDLGDIEGAYTSISDDCEIYSIIDNFVDLDNTKVYNVNVRYHDQEHKFNFIDSNSTKSVIFDFIKDEDVNIIINNQIHTINTDEKIENTLHIKTHMFRERMIDMFDVSDISILTSRYDELGLVNDNIIKLMRDVNNEPNDTSKNDIKILNQLQMDLSNIISEIHQNKLTGVSQNLMKFISEHKNQYSISTLKNNRSCYSGSNDKLLNLKLIKSMFNDVDLTCQKTIMIDKNDSNYNQKSYIDDNLKCFIYHSGWRDDCLGIGLHILPKTLREIQRNLLPDIKVDCNYMSLSAFNSGITIKFEENPLSILKDKDISDESIILSSTNGNINCWIPIYINKYHWNDAKYYVDSAVSLIAFQNNDMTNLEKTVEVYTNLFIRNVVNFIETETLPENSIQIFGYLYRTLLALIDDNKDILKIVNDKLNEFVSTPHMRSRRYCSNLGDIVNLLFLSDKDWKETKTYYIPEMMRRSIIKLENFDELKQMTTENDLIETFSKGTEQFFKKSMFTIHLIRSLREESLEETKDYFDSRWGLIGKDKIDVIKKGFNDIVKNNNVKFKLDFLEFNGNIKDLILWSVKYKDSNCELYFKNQTFDLNNFKFEKDVVINEHKEKIRKNMILFFPNSKSKILNKDRYIDYFSKITKNKFNVILEKRFGLIKTSFDDFTLIFNQMGSFTIDENIFYLDLNKRCEKIYKSKNYKSKKFKRQNKFMKKSGHVVNKEFIDVKLNDFLKIDDLQNETLYVEFVSGMYITQHKYVMPGYSIDETLLGDWRVNISIW
jgi:hypothetical protein